MSSYVQPVYLVQSISIMNLNLLPLKTCVSSESRMSRNSLTAIATHSTAVGCTCTCTCIFFLCMYMDNCVQQRIFYMIYICIILYNSCYRTLKHVYNTHIRVFI